MQVWGDKIQIPWICAGLRRQNSDLQCKFKTSLKKQNKKRANISRKNHSWADTAVRRARQRWHLDKLGTDIIFQSKTGVSRAERERGIKIVRTVLLYY